MKVGAEARAMARIDGEVQRYQFGPDGAEWVSADDYAALNEYSALVEMNLQAQIELDEAYEARLLAENEWLRATLAKALTWVPRSGIPGRFKAEVEKQLSAHVEVRHDD